MFFKIKIVIIPIIVMLALAVTQCNPQPNRSTAQPEGEEHETGHDDPSELSPVPLTDGQKLKAVATTNIVGDLVQTVGGELIELTTLLPIGADPHTFSPAPQDVAAVADAHVVFVNGLHLEEFLEELIENAGGEALVVVLSSSVTTREFEEMDAHEHDEDEGEHHNEDEEDHQREHEEHDEDEGKHHNEDEEDHEDEDEHHHTGVDPHIWTSPANVIVMVHTIEEALSQLDPANAAAFAANAAAYETELEALDAWVMAQIESIPAENRTLVTDHEALGYYAARYGLEVVGAVIPASSTSAEPSAQELAALQATIAEFGVQAVFVGTTVNPVLAERVAGDTGIKLVPLYTGSLGKTGSGVETYLDYIRYNTTTIVEALR